MRTKYGEITILKIIIAFFIIGFWILVLSSMVSDIERFSLSLDLRYYLIAFFIYMFLFLSGFILNIYDAPDDQGGYVFVNWNANSLDVLPNTDITHYSVWRFLPNERGWEHLTDVPASYEDSYGFNAPTIETSTQGEDALLTTYKVIECTFWIC